MNAATDLPRPSLAWLVAESYRQFFRAFRAFFPLLAGIAIAYILVCAVAYQVDERLIGMGSESAPRPFWIETLAASSWLDLLFVPCAIWWIRLQWFGQQHYFFQAVFSRNGAVYAALTALVTVGLSLLFFLTDRVAQASDSDWQYFLVICVAIVIVLAVYLVVEPIYVSLAVNYTGRVLPAIAKLARNSWYFAGLSLAIFFPPIILFAVLWVVFEDYLFAHSQFVELFNFVIVAVFGSVWAVAQTLLFEWLVGQSGRVPRPGDRSHG